MNYYIEHDVAVAHCHWRTSYRFLSGSLPRRPVSGLPTESSGTILQLLACLLQPHLFRELSRQERVKTRARASF